MYGLRFILTITGNGGKFDLYYLFLSVGKLENIFIEKFIYFIQGSGISCLIIADFICEFIFLYIHKNNNLFRENKITVCDFIEDQINIDKNKF
jgi:hypothetical protein